MTKEGVIIAPDLALGSWAAFKSMGDDTMMMGDLVLTQDEIEPVMLKLEQEKIEQSALHNHLLGEAPRMHVHACRWPWNAVMMATSLASALALTKTPGGSSPRTSNVAEAPAPTTETPAATPKPIDLDTNGVEQALGFSGKVNGGILQFCIPRKETITDGEMEFPPSMGTATAINFQPTGGGRAAISGDFILLASEVNPVIKALRTHGIEVEAVHNHMLTERTHLYFMHFWANDDATKLAQGLHAALSVTNSVTVATK